MNEFTGIWLPAEILSIPVLNLTQKVLAAQVVMLSRSGECTAQNEYLSNQIEVTETCVSLNLKKLKEKGWIEIESGQKEGNKRTMYPSLKLLNTLFKNIKEGVAHLNPFSLKLLKTLFKIIKDPLSNCERPYLKILKTLFKDFKEHYIRNENKGESKEESKDESFLPAESGSDENSNLVETEQPEGTPPPPTPAPDFPSFGDGELRAQCLQYFTDYPDLYPLDMYTQFLRYWTQPQEGKEKWRHDRAWPLQTRLTNWHTNYLKDVERERNGTSKKRGSRTSADFLARQRAAEPQSIDDYGDL